MTNRNRRLLTAAAAIIAAATTILPARQMTAAMHPGHQAPPAHHTCTAEVIPFEDGSWLGGPLRYDGRVIYPNWATDRIMPKVGFLPGYRGIACKLIITKG